MMAAVDVMIFWEDYLTTLINLQPWLSERTKIMPCPGKEEDYLV